MMIIVIIIIIVHYQILRVCLLQQVSGSGPEGQVRAQDVVSFTPGVAPLAAPMAAVPGAGFVDFPTSNIRQVSHHHRGTGGLADDRQDGCVVGYPQT